MLQVSAQKLTLKNVTSYITDIICKRAELGYNYGVILIPEGLIDFIPEVLIHSFFPLNVCYNSLSTGYRLDVKRFFFSKISTLQAQQLISELNEIVAHDSVDKEGVWKKKLRGQSCQLFEFLPQDIQDQLLLERDPHGNVQV